MQYCVARSADPGPIGENFGAACDQIDRADTMLAGLHDRARHGRILSCYPPLMVSSGGQVRAFGGERGWVG
jgi:hypothetical protein